MNCSTKLVYRDVVLQQGGGRLTPRFLPEDIPQECVLRVGSILIASGHVRSNLIVKANHGSVAGYAPAMIILECHPAGLLLPSPVVVLVRPTNIDSPVLVAPNLDYTGRSQVTAFMPPLTRFFNDRDYMGGYILHRSTVVVEPDARWAVPFVLSPYLC